MNTKKRVLIIINKFVYGGIETTLLEILNQVDYNKYDITVGCMIRGGELEKNIPKRVHIVYLTKFDVFPSGLRRKLIDAFILFAPGKIVYKKFIKDNYDSIICYHGDFVSILKGFKGKKTCWIHGDWFPFKITNTLLGKIRKRLLLKHMRSCDKIVCVSNHLKDKLTTFFNNKLDNIIFQRNAINPRKIEEKSNEKVSDYDFNDGLLHFISVGRLARQKGYDLLIPIVANLHQKNSNFKLLIIGDGEERKNLENLIESHGANDFITLLGMKANPFPYVKNSDVFICSSRMEGYSTSISEAIILGKCIVSTNCGGSDQLLDYGKAGILVENNSEGINKGLYEILANQDLIKIYSEKSKERSKVLFNLSEIIKEIVEVCF